MKFIITGTKDTVVGEVMTNNVNFYRNEAEAKRSWGNAIEELSQNNPQKVPILDLQLYKLGEFDTETMELVSRVEFLACGADFIKRPTAPKVVDNEICN